MSSTDVIYGNTADGLPAAQVGTTSYCVIPFHKGYRIAMKSHYQVPELSSLHSDDFYSHLGSVADESAFRAEMEDIAEHLRELQALCRVEIESSTSTPWGKSQGATVIAEKAIYAQSTASHGGYKVYSSFNKRIPEPYRNENGWYEEDCEYAKVVVSLPQYFTKREVRHATDTVINWYPDEYEQVSGVKLEPGQSKERDRQVFQKAHANDWIGISASGFEDLDGEKLVLVTATRGGERGTFTTDVDTKEFVVPAAEYQAGYMPYGFVIDEARHIERSQHTAKTLEAASEEPRGASEEELNHLFGVKP